MTGEGEGRGTIGLGPGGASGELAGLVQPFRLLARTRRLHGAPRGHGSRVVVLPGHNFGDGTTAVLRRYLAGRGHDVSGWGLGRNDHDARTMVQPMIAELDRRVDEGATGRAALVGQSLGGFLAREVARHRPDLVSRVITLGSPLYAPTSALPITVPITALWSRSDHVVPPGWTTDDGPTVELVEVRSTHFAMGFDPDVWLVVADRLARA
ncbi:hypothetical protein KSP35_05190 [Aquihabitans sp. G128]|uniref:lipase family alpha/beta hydrolase n=1 Tax=Aquihabitans sp. G128 TaxID=2849779 RepID=UPI001C24AB31|nr:alpha/beta hydrolase [Aquihabitans sp. G128]QXC62206.1 hypothetical protein KSP35_05190 [Aquihabitans sp. G128]